MWKPGHRLWQRLLQTLAKNPSPENSAAGYTCHCCGQHHPELPMHYGMEAPLNWYGIPEKERDVRSQRTSDCCVIDETSFYLVGNLEIPVHGTSELFSWDVWVSLSEKNFRRAMTLWETPGRESEPPYFGWLSTRLPGYPDTINLKTMVHSRQVGRRPRIELEPTDHPLAVEQRQGITRARLQQIAELVLHGSDHPSASGEGET